MKHNTFYTFAFLMVFFFTVPSLIAQQRNGNQRSGQVQQERSWELAKELQSTLTADQKATLFSKLEAMKTEQSTRGNRNAALHRFRSQRLQGSQARPPRLSGPLAEILTDEQKEALKESARENNPMIDQRERMMIEALALSQQQENQLKNLREKQQAEMKGLQEKIKSGDMSRNEIQSSLASLRSNHEQGMESILTNQQLELVKIHQAVIIRGKGRDGVKNSRAKRGQRQRGTQRRNGRRN